MTPEQHDEKAEAVDIERLHKSLQDFVGRLKQSTDPATKAAARQLALNLRDAKVKPNN